MGHVCHEFLPALLVAVLLRHVVQYDQDTALVFGGEGRQVNLQGPLSHPQLVGHVVGLMQCHHLLEGMQVTQQLLVGAVRLHGLLQQIVCGRVAVDQAALVVKGHHAVRHVEEQGVQLVALILHGGQGGLQNPGHLVEGAGQNADLVGGLHRQLAVKVTGGHLFGTGGQLFNGTHHGLGQQKAQQYGDQQANDQGLYDQQGQLAVQLGDGVLVVQNIDDKGVAVPQDRHGHIHIIGGDVAVIPHSGAVAGDHGVPCGQQIGALLPGEGILSGGTVQIVASDAVQHEVVPGAVVDTQLTGPDFQHLLDEGGAIGLGGAAAQVRYEGLLVLAEYAVDLLVEGVDIEAGHTGGQKGTHHRHQG